MRHWETRLDRLGILKAQTLGIKHSLKNIANLTFNSHHTQAKVARDNAGTGI